MKEYVTLDEVDRAWRDCRKHKGSSYGCMEYFRDFISNNYELYKDLNSMTYEIGQSRVFCVTRLGLTLHPDKVYLQEARKGVRMTGAVIKPHRVYVGNNTVRHLFEIIKEWNELENPIDDEARIFANRCNSLFGLMVHRDSYAIRWRAWKSMRHKGRIYCENMRKICVTYKNKRL